MSKENLFSVAGELETPAFIFCDSIFRKNLDDFRTAFEKRYLNMNAAYSYKTNYLPYVCKAANAAHCYAEVTSPMEYLHAVRCGVNRQNIILNGVCSTTELWEEAIAGGSTINADSYQDFRQIASIAEKVGAEPIVGVRLNLDLGNGRASRFGVDPESQEYKDILTLARESGIGVAGLHCHITYARDLESWRKRAELMAHYAGEICDLLYIDMGSNLFGAMPEYLAAQYGGEIPSFDDYADVICGVLNDRFPGQDVELILEPGTPLISNAMYLATKVTRTKEIRGVKYAILDCNIFDVSFSIGSQELPVLLQDEDVGDEQFTLTGCTCLETDVLRKKVTADLKTGSLLLFENVGAYKNNLSRDFIRPGIPIYVVDGNGVSMVRRRTEYDDAFAEYA